MYANHGDAESVNRLEQDASATHTTATNRRVVLTKQQFKVHFVCDWHGGLCRCLTKIVLLALKSSHY